MRRVEKMVESDSICFCPSSRIPFILSSSSNEEEYLTYILGLETRSSFNENSLREYVKENNLKEICYFVPTPHYRIGDHLIWGTGFYARVIEDEVGLPIHPFLWGPRVLWDHARAVNPLRLVSHGGDIDDVGGSLPEGSFGVDLTPS